MGDREIIELYWQRNEAALEESQRAYGGYCFAVANNILADREDAEECVNDTWLRAWNAIPPHRPHSLSAFFGCITRNLSLDKYAAKRAAKRGGSEVELVLDELEECIGISDTVEQATENAELEASINAFLYTLPDRERNIFLCRYWDMKTLRAISEKYGIKEANVKASLYRSRAKLKLFIEREGIIL